MSNKQNDIIEETKQDAIAERTYTVKELKDILNKEMIKLIEAMTDWGKIAECWKDYSKGIIDKEILNERIEFHMGLIKARTEDSKKVREELEK